MPFNICQPHCSHVDMTHGALEFSCLSILFLGSVMSSIVGDSSPTLVFQSPQMSDPFCVGMWLRVSSMQLRAISSSIPRFYKFCTGGKQTFPIHTLPPPCTWMQTAWAYSFPVLCNILMPFFMMIAIPPLLPVFRRFSYTQYPGTFNGMVDSVNHVSYRHNTSNVWASNSIKSLNILIPAMFILPIFIPIFAHLFRRMVFSFFILADPFVRFRFLFFSPT